MFPDFSFIGLPFVKTYGLCMALGFLLAWRVFAAHCRFAGRDPERYSNFLIALMLSGVLGSRVAYVVEHWSSEFAAHPAQVFAVWQGGLMFYGGLVLALAVFAVWCFARRESALRLADLLAAVIPLGHACGRIGCFFYGCCYGRTSSCALAVAFPRGSPAWYEQLHDGAIASNAAHALPVLPTQFFEAAALLALFAALGFVYRRFAARRPGLTAGVYLCGYAAIRFALEYLRGDPRAAVGPLSISQTISLGVFVVGCAFAGWSLRAGRQEGTHA